MRLSMLSILLIFITDSFSQNNHIEIVDSSVLSIIFNKDSSRVRFKNKNLGNFLEGKKKIVYEDNSYSLMNFKMGYPNGKWTKMDDTKIVYFVTEYNEGRKHGLDILYYTNGTKKLVAKFIDGYQEGVTLMYYPSGILGGEFDTLKGKKHGVERWFNEVNGKVIYKAYYLNNTKVDSIRFHKEYKR